MNLDQILDRIDLGHLLTRVIEFLPRLGLAVVIFVSFLLLFRVTRPALRGMLQRAGLHAALVKLLTDNLYYYTILIVAVVIAAEQVGVDVTAALAGLGLVGVAVGFAAQDSVANMIAGIVIFWDKPFVVGDWVKAADDYGQVTTITLRSTRIRTPRNTYVVIPNKNIIDDVLENFSKHGDLRVDVPLGIAYKESVAAAREVLLGAVKQFEFIKSDPAPDVVVEELGNSSVNLRVRVWIDDSRDQQKTYFTVMEAAKVALDAAGIQIPFPHMQLFLEDVRKPVWQQLAAMGGEGGPGPRPRN